MRIHTIPSDQFGLSVDGPQDVSSIISVRSTGARTGSFL